MAAKRAFPFPNAVPDEQAAMFLVNSIAAFAMVHDVLRVRRGSRLLVTAAGPALGKSAVRCLGHGGHLLVYGTLSDEPMLIPSRDLMMPNAKVAGFYLDNWIAGQPPLRLLNVLRTVRKLSAEGVFRAVAAEMFPLEHAAAAVAAAIAPGRTGKVLLRIGSASSARA